MLLDQKPQTTDDPISATAPWFLRLVVMKHGRAYMRSDPVWLDGWL